MIDLSVELDGYSGPFDLLCSLVESRKFQVSGIKISQLIKIYGLYLVKTRQTPADALADFFYMTAGLLLEKTRSLLPGYNDEIQPSAPDERVFIESLERYRPYREIYLWLSEKFASMSPSYRRGICEPENDSEREIIIDGSGAYILGKTWKSISQRYAEALTRKKTLNDAESKADWDGFSNSNKDEQKQIEQKISEIEAMLSLSKSLSLQEISGKNFIVALLAVLELCRMGRAYIEQDELFSDVRVITKN